MCVIVWCNNAWRNYLHTVFMSLRLSGNIWFGSFIMGSPTAMHFRILSPEQICPFARPNNTTTFEKKNKRHNLCAIVDCRCRQYNCDKLIAREKKETKRQLKKRISNAFISREKKKQMFVSYPGTKLRKSRSGTWSENCENFSINAHYYCVSLRTHIRLDLTIFLPLL